MKSFFSSILPVVLLLLFCTCGGPEQTTLVLLPDVQSYTENYPHILHSQVDWIVEHSTDFDMVLQQGDLTEHNNREEWEVARAAFSKLNHVIPYVLAVGNHDMGSAPGKNADVRNTAMFNTFFPYREMAQLPAFGDVFEPEKMDNAYYLFESGNRKWMVLTMEFGPRESVLEWANKVVDSHPERVVIVNTHGYMYSDSTRMGPGDKWLPQSYGIGKDTGQHRANNGEQIWRKLVKKHPNIRFVFSGHVLNSGVGTLISVNDEGFPVYQLLANYQNWVKGSVNGGNGFLRILTLDHKTHTLTVKTYSPYIDEYKMEEEQSFVIRDVVVREKMKK
jgi:hypothetical protein